VRVAHRQTPIRKKGYPKGWPFFMAVISEVKRISSFCG